METGDLGACTPVSFWCLDSSNIRGFPYFQSSRRSSPCVPWLLRCWRGICFWKRLYKTLLCLQGNYVKLTKCKVGLFLFMYKGFHKWSTCHLFCQSELVRALFWSLSSGDLSLFVVNTCRFVRFFWSLSSSVCSSLLLTLVVVVVVLLDSSGHCLPQFVHLCC